MPDDPLPDGVTVALDRDTVSASAVVSASPEEVFDFIRRPANHPEISGDHTVKGTTTGAEVLEAGSRFGMRMKMFGLPYRMTNKVREFEDGTLVAWANPGGQTWRWEVVPSADGQAIVTETFDLSTALVPPGLRLAGFPKRHRDNVARSVANVRRHFTPGGGG